MIYFEGNRGPGPTITLFSRRISVRALITGITGFAGGHLAHTLLGRGDEIIGVARHEREDLTDLGPKIVFVAADLREPASVDRILRTYRPEAIYHLAGQASVSRAWTNPWETLEDNIRPQLNILQSMIKQDLTARLLVVASNEVYGQVKPAQLPVREDMPTQPDNPYGVSKVAQDALALQYHLSHGVDVLRVRAFNHIGPRQSPIFVAASFAKQIAEIEAGLCPPIMRVGNLEAQRDFTDVVDVVRAYALLVEQGRSGDVYNVGTGRAYSIRYLLDVLLLQTPVEISIERDPARMRPSDNPIIYADNNKLRQQTGWEPLYKFEDSLKRVLDYWREELKRQHLS
jgi:GDP-4-dehydro-6-deoxy-D-mannose reductase